MLRYSRKSLVWEIDLPLIQALIQFRSPRSQPEHLRLGACLLRQLRRLHSNYPRYAPNCSAFPPFESRVPYQSPSHPRSYHSTYDLIKRLSIPANQSSNSPFSSMDSAPFENPYESSVKIWSGRRKCGWSNVEIMVERRFDFGFAAMIVPKTSLGLEFVMPVMRKRESAMKKFQGLGFSTSTDSKC